MLIDSHCHIDMLNPADYGASDITGLMQLFAEAGVTRMLCVGVDWAGYEPMRALLDGYANVDFSTAVHPNDEGYDPSIEELVARGQDPRIVAIGETGLDYFRSEGELEWQRDRFRRHIRAAKTLGKPLIIHSRNAAEDTIRILGEEHAEEVGGVLHCFAEDWETAQKGMDLGFYISFSGIITFKSANQMREVAAQVPLERLLIETDSPYLAPVPYRGKPNHPGLVVHVAQQLAEIKQISFQALAEQTAQNYLRLFQPAITC